RIGTEAGYRHGKTSESQSGNCPIGSDLPLTSYHAKVPPASINTLVDTTLDLHTDEADIDLMNLHIRRLAIALLMCVPFVAVIADGQPVPAGPSGEGRNTHMVITSKAFENQHAIPAEYSCHGQDVSPALRWEDVPSETKSLALIVDDPDAPMGTWVHWVVYNIPVDRTAFERAVPKTERLQDGTFQGKGSNGRIGYAGPCPPSGTHRYFFKLYALDAQLSLRPGATKEQLLSAMQGHILQQSELVGTFSK
ncbi:MAG TPA: YbhB/YbcL family Raf kinase inhibitor-like protein, partial [Spirochaetia bacterium]|nr:YbhB/YbcL family Raf kinase inhibitor-like protein [Spirochaetia bacterium]